MAFNNTYLGKAYQKIANLTSKYSELSFNSPRQNRYSDFVVSNSSTNLQASVEGSAWSFVTQTPGTSITLAAVNSSSYTVANPAFLLFNKNVYEQEAHIIPRRLKMIVTTASNGSPSRITIVISKGNRYISGGTLMTAVNCNTAGSNSNSSAALGYVGGSTLISAAATGVVDEVVSNRVIGQTYMKNAVYSIGDEILLSFGEPADGSAIGTAITTGNRFCATIPAISIPPGCTMMIYMGANGQTIGPAIEYQFDYIER